MTLFYIETYGCQMNKAESSTLISLMIEKGFAETKDYQEADIIIINTCSVRKTAENRVFGRLGFFKRQKRFRPLDIVVMGCMSQRIGEQLINSHYGIDFVVGNFNKEKIPELLLHKRKGEKGLFIEEATVVFPDPYPEESNPSKAFVTISHGCNNFCSYCIVPYLRGREVSKNSADIIKDINRLTSLGVLQVTLLGQNVNSYGLDKHDIDFPDLLKMIVKETDLQWIKFMSSHPKDFSDKLIDVMATEDRVASWVHLALQSGSDRILELMNRKYTSGDFKEIVRKLKSSIPEIALTTDIIVGFPGETEADFNDTLDMIDFVQFDDAFMYKYNERDNTLAHKEWVDDVPDKEKVARLTKLIDIQRVINHSRREERVGKIYEVIPERLSQDGSGKVLGVAREEFMVLYDGSEDDFGKIVNVKTTAANGSSLVGVKV